MTKRILISRGVGKGVVSFLFLFSVLIVQISCSSNNKGAKQYLQEAESALAQKNYSLAKLKIDSIKTLFPKAYGEINAGFQLMQVVRKEENQRNIAFCDSMLTVSYDKLKQALLKFNYVRDERYQEFGNYIPKLFSSNQSLNQRTLRAGVSEKGALYIESVLPGSAIKHNRIKISSKDGSFAETLPVTSDGLNYQFKTINNSYEIVRYTGNDENGIANFIFTFKDQPLTISFIGNKTVNTALTKTTAEGISQSVELSNLLQEIERLKLEKEKSEVLIRYLEERKK